MTPLSNDSLDDGVAHGNCAEVLPTLPPSCVQTVFVDPPYNIGIDYGNGKKADQLDPLVYLTQMEAVAYECCRVLNETESMWFLSPERWADDFGRMLRELLPRRNRVIWRETFGQYHEHRFPSGHRHLFWHVKDAQASPFHADDIRVASQRMIDGDKRACGPRVPDDVWEIPRLVGNAKERLQQHPCQLPEKLLQRIILCSTGVGDRVLDPMCGTGTTLRVAQRLGRRYLGIEQQSHFVDLIRTRLKNEYQTTFFDRS
jgi:site-specific DNA-methyltransferase (adenine-specific)